MFEVLPTQCLHWLMQVISALENQQTVTEMEQGLWHWADKLLPQLQSLYAGEWGQHPEAANLLGEYCERCLELCDAMSQHGEESCLDGHLLNDWKSQVSEAASAFRQAEQALNENGGLASLLA